MKCPRGNLGFCRCCLDCTSLIRCGKKHGLPEEEAVAEDMEPKESKTSEDKDEEDVPKMEGYLEKKGKSRLVSSWRRYWFVLEGRRLTYYESQPHPTVELPPSCKGSLTIAPATSVTTSKQPSSNGAGHQPSYQEIYILNSSRLVTLRTKDAEHHTSWVKALVASTKLPVKSQPTNGSKSPKSTGTTNLFPLQPSTKYFRYSMTNLSAPEEIRTPRPKNGAHTMDARSCSLYQRKSGSLDDMLDRYDDMTKESGKEAASSDSDDEENEDPKSKVVSPDTEDHQISQSLLGYKLPMIEHELPPARLCESKEKDLVQRKERLEEMSAPAVENWDKIHPSPNVDENYAAELDLSRYIELTGHSSGKQSETHEGKVKARRFLTSLVSKESKIFEGICKPDKAPKKERQSVALDQMGTTIPSPVEKNEKPKVKHKHTSTQLEVKERLNDAQRVQKVMSVNEASHSGSSVRNSLMKRTSEFRTARRIKRNKDKKTSETDEVASKEASHVPSFSRQNSRKEKAMTVAPLLEENDPKKKRKRMGFLSKMLRGKKSDGQEEVAERYDILQDLPFDGMESSPRKYGITHDSDVTEDELSPRANPVVVPPHLSFGLKLFPGDDAELKRKLESRMARIESEMASTLANQNLPESTQSRRIGEDNALSVEDAGKMGENRKSFEETVSSPPPTLPPRLIKLTPPTPPVHTGLQEDISFCERTPGFSQELELGIASKDLNGMTNTAESNQRRGINDVILCERNESGWQASIQNMSELNCDVTISETTHPGELSGNADKSGSEWESDVLRTLLKVSDVGVDTDCGASSKSAKDPPSRLSWENQRECDGNGASSVQTVRPVAIEPGMRTSGHVDELSLLLSELDRMNSSPLNLDVSKSNHRPVSEEVKKPSAFEVDYITAYPIRRRRNSDPDYDIPRPHRIPHIQPTKEESRVEAPPASMQQSDRRSSGRENTDSIVIEATRFFGPGMDFSFNEKKYSEMKNSEDLWDYPYNCKNQELDFTKSDYMYSGECERLKDSSDSDFQTNTAKEPLVGSLAQANGNKGESEAQGTNSANQEEDAVLRPKTRLDIVDYGDNDKVVLRSSSMDRACRKERSREIYEADLTDQFKLNDLLEGLSISSQLGVAGESEAVGNGGCSDDHTMHDHTATMDLSSNEICTHGLLNQEASSKSSEDLHTVYTPEIPEQKDENFISPNDSESVRNEELDTLPHSTSASAMEEWAALENSVDEHEDEVVLRSKVDSSSREDSRAFRLSFATTETLLVEEEVLVATLKTTTTTTTLLPMEDGSTQESRENVEEFVEEIVLDMDQLSDDRFDSMQVHSCVQT